MTLSDREAEVFRLVALGHRNAEIAEMMFLSVKTIETYKARLMRKLGAETRAQLVRLALEVVSAQDLEEYSSPEGEEGEGASAGASTGDGLPPAEGSAGEPSDADVDGALGEDPESEDDGEES